MPELSIITINYNNFSGLEKTLTSVFQQSYKNYEYIVIDGGSTDNSRQLLSDHAANLSCWISEPDDGVYHAMNKGIALARGTYLMFLNSGDYLINEAVLQDAAAAMQQAGADVYYGDIIIEREAGTPVSKKHPQQISLQYILNQTINHQASFIRRQLFTELGNYNTGYRFAADHAFYVKAFLAGKTFMYLDMDMVHYELTGISSQNAPAYYAEMMAIKEAMVPPYVKELQQQILWQQAVMQQRIVRTALGVNKWYQGCRKLLKKNKNNRTDK